jgi:hypothetical protein
MSNVFLSHIAQQLPKANPAALTAVDDSLVANGVIGFVISLNALFHLDKSSALTADNVNVIATLSGTGRWVRMTNPVLYTSPLGDRTTPVTSNQTLNFPCPSIIVCGVVATPLTIKLPDLTTGKIAPGTFITAIVNLDTAHPVIVRNKDDVEVFSAGPSGMCMIFADNIASNTFAYWLTASMAVLDWPAALLQQSQNLLDLADVAIARTNLGLGDLAVLNAPLPVAYGGTAATTAANARTNLGLGSMATQAASNIAVTGGTESGVTMTDNAFSNRSKTISATSYTLVAGDAGAILNFTANAASGTVTVTLPKDVTANIPAGSFIWIRCKGGAGALVTVVAESGAVYNYIGNSDISDDGEIIILKDIFANTYKLFRIYEIFVHISDWSGIWASAISGSIIIERNNAEINAKIIAAQATASIAAPITLVTPIPARFRVATNTEFAFLVVQNAGNNTFGPVTINAGGGMTVFRTALIGSAYGNFTGAANSGLNNNTMRWLLG